MIKIALCDDDSQFVSKITGLIQSLLQSRTDSPVITTYINPVALIASVSDGERYDIYILDVEMPDLNGMDVARQIRGYQPNAALFFLSSHLSYATEGYKVQALRYVSKLDLENALPEALEQALATLEKTDTHSIMVQHYQNYTRILYKDILYVQKMQRSIQIVTDRQGNFKDNCGLKELFAEIDDPRFIFTDRAYFVNLDYVQELDGSWLVLTNEDRVPISRPMMPSVKKAMIALWGGKNKK